MSITPRVDMIGLTTHDMARSLDFYRLLGLDVSMPDPPRPYVETTLAGGIRLSWNTAELMKSLHPEWAEPRGQRMNLAFHCGGAKGVDAVYGRVIEAGFRAVRPPWDAFWGQRYAQLRDPDGNPVDLYAALG